MGSVVKCTACESVLNESPGLEPSLRKGCQKCGSLGRKISITVSENMELHEGFRAKVKKEGLKRPAKEVKGGDEFYGSTREWRKVTRVIDRENDSYTEKITRKNGIVVKDVRESLRKDHQGHGSAKSKKEKEKDTQDDDD